jgi:glucose/mannose transport system substrate-binding protein
MRNIIGKHALLIACVSFATMACGGDDEGEDTKEVSGSIEIFSWWTSGDEVAALNALIDVHEAKYPKTTVTNLAEALADEARPRLQQRMSDGSPPDTFQANAGRDLLKWALFNGTDDSDTKIESLNDMAEANDWNTTFPKPVLDALSYNDKLYGVAPNIHRINSMFYSIPIFEAEGLTAPTTLDELLTVADALKTAGYIPLCIGSEGSWTLQEFVMEDVFPAVAGGDYYMSYWQGNESADSQQMADTLTYMMKLWPYFNTDANSKQWTAGIDHMFNTGAPGEADAPCAMTVMGDWAKGYLQSGSNGHPEWKPGVDFEQIPFPGTVGTFVFTADSFPLPKGAPNGPGARALLETIGSAEGQVAFNLKKGSIPVRTDVDRGAFDATVQKTMDDFADPNGKLVTALSGLLPADKFGTLADQLKDMLATDDPAPVLTVLANDYSSLSQ